jgi:hypothetical protein
LFVDIERVHGAPDLVIYNASARTRGPFVQLVPAEVQRALQTTRTSPTRCLIRMRSRWLAGPTPVILMRAEWVA